MSHLKNTSQKQVESLVLLSKVIAIILLLLNYSSLSAGFSYSFSVLTYTSSSLPQIPGDHEGNKPSPVVEERFNTFCQLRQACSHRRVSRNGVSQKMSLKTAAGSCAKAEDMARRVAFRRREAKDSCCKGQLLLCKFVTEFVGNFRRFIFWHMLTPTT